MTKAQSSIRDAKDLYLLSLAETIQADYILTGAIARKESIGAHYIEPDEE